MRLRVRPRFLALIGALLLAAALVSCGASLLRVVHLNGRIGEAQSLLARRQLRLADLQAQLEYAQTDQYVQAIARQELNLLFPGEIRYIAG